MPIKIIAIANQKGGTAKTTTAAALAVLLSRRGTPVHVIDLDPQASLTRAFGHRDDTDGFYNALTSRAGLPVQSVCENLTLTPSTIELGRVETELLTEPGREFFLRVALERTPLPENTVVFLDCPPSLGVLSVNALAIAGGIIAVAQPGGFELYGLMNLTTTLDAVRERINRDLHFLGVIVTNAHQRRAITKQMGMEVGLYGALLGTIRSDSRLLYATTRGLIHKLTSSKAMDDYAGVLTRLSGILP